MCSILFLVSFNETFPFWNVWLCRLISFTLLNKHNIKLRLLKNLLQCTFMSLHVNCFITSRTTISMWACRVVVSISRLYCCMIVFHLVFNSISVISCDSQPTPRSASTNLELGKCLSISLSSTLLLLLLFLQWNPLAFSLTTLSPSPLSKHLQFITESLPSASAFPLLLPLILLSFHLYPPLLFLLLRPVGHLSSMAVQDLPYHICRLLHRVESQVLCMTPGWFPPFREQVCVILIILFTSSFIYYQFLKLGNFWAIT